MVYKNWASLERAVVDKVRVATQEAQTASLKRLSEYLDRFYDSPEPNMYERTMQLGSSASAPNFQPTSNGGVGMIEINDDVNYAKPGLYDTMMVIENAETGYVPPTAPWATMKGNPYFWQDTMTDIENEIIPNTFGKYFRRV